MKEMECEFCGKETDGSYIDRGMHFCNPSCALEQAKEKLKKHEIQKWDDEASSERCSALNHLDNARNLTEQHDFSNARVELDNARISINKFEYALNQKWRYEEEK